MSRKNLCVTMYLGNDALSLSLSLSLSLCVCVCVCVCVSNVQGIPSNRHMTRAHESDKGTRPVMKEGSREGRPLLGMPGLRAAAAADTQEYKTRKEPPAPIPPPPLLC